MKNDELVEKQQHYDREADEYDSIYFDSTDKYKPPLVAKRIIVDRFLSDEVAPVLDMGCGNGGVLLALLERGINAKGFDLSPEMVERAKEHLDSNGFDPNRVVQANVENGIPFDDSGFDGICAIGLLPHLEEKESTLELIREKLNENGTALIQFRNDLFSAYSYNEYTYQFVRNDLVSEGVPDVFESTFNQRLREVCDLNGNTPGGGQEADPEGEFSNPLTIEPIFEAAGFDVTDVLFYHYHPLPPEFREIDPEAYDKLCQSYEDPHDWRGHLMASAFIVVAEPSKP